MMGACVYFRRKGGYRQQQVWGVIAHPILDQGADYLLARKENQAHLYADGELLCDDLVESGYTAYAYESETTVAKGHGRIEGRKVWTISPPALLQALRGTARWPPLTPLVKVQAERSLPAAHTGEVRYLISSLATSAADLLSIVRTHWGIENSFHWVLDIAFREDAPRLRKDNGAQNFALLCHLALNALTQETSLDIGIKNKRLRAGWDNRYLLNVLSALIA